LKSRNFIKSGLIVIILGVGCALAAYFAPPVGQNSQAGMWYSIVPPVLAIALAFLTHRVLLSLGIAVIAGSLLTEVPQAPLSAAAWLEGVKALGVCAADTVANKTHLQILAFIPPIFVMIEIVIAVGGFKGIMVWLLKWVKGRRSAQMATAVMGLLCFIDDYANAIIVGSMMQPITDRFRISREKLAFLVDATSAPVSGLAVISTWIAYEVGLFADTAQKLGIEKSGYALFFDALSFRFYCLLMLFFVFVHILFGRDFGPMKTAEKSAETGARPEKGKSSSPEAVAGPAPPVVTKEPGRAVNAILPLGGLILFHLTVLWLDGGGPARLSEGGSLFSWIYWRDVISHAQNSHLILVGAALFGMTLALLCGLFFASLRLSVVRDCFRKGIKRAIMPSAILILAWSLKNCCESLKTGEFLTTILADRISPYWFPPVVFIVASLTSFATGTSWGTMAILIPTAIPIAFSLDGQTYGLTTMISLGAILDGAIFGDHCSPISDTTIISSTASSCDLIRHVRTQLPYSLLVAAMALLCGYLPSAFGFSSRLSLLLAMLVIVCLFVVLRRFRRA
jgi:Na+/H+ antiporter NhaC